MRKWPKLIRFVKKRAHVEKLFRLYLSRNYTAIKPAGSQTLTCKAFHCNPLVHAFVYNVLSNMVQKYIVTRIQTRVAPDLKFPNPAGTGYAGFRSKIRPDSPAWTRFDLLTDFKRKWIVWNMKIVKHLKEPNLQYLCHQLFTLGQQWRHQRSPKVTVVEKNVGYHSRTEQDTAWILCHSDDHATRTPIKMMMSIPKGLQPDLRRSVFDLDQMKMVTSWPNKWPNLTT